jgi:hypothetical protein
MANASLEIVNLKLNRAQKHLDEITAMLSLLEYGECTIVPEYNESRDLVVQRIHITPKPTLELSVAVGYYLFAMRSALDYLVWQLIVCNGEIPTKDNMFPITTSAENFLVPPNKRKRLKGAFWLEYLDTYRRFKFSNLMTQRGLGDAQAKGSGSECPFFGDSNDVF